METVSSSVEANTKSKSRILYVDDAQIDRELSKLVLSKNGFEVLTLSSGVTCLDKIKEFRPNLLLLDVMMPDMEGNHLLQKVRELYSSIDLPIIMMTVKSDTADIVKSLELGANDFVSKPVDYEVLMRRIQTHLSVNQLALDLAKFRELQATHDLISSYAHELNNPLAIAIGYVDRLRTKYPEDQWLTPLEEALWRIADTLKKSRDLLDR